MGTDDDAGPPSSFVVVLMMLGREPSRRVHFGVGATEAPLASPQPSWPPHACLSLAGADFVVACGLGDCGPVAWGCAPAHPLPATIPRMAAPTRLAERSGASRALSGARGLPSNVTRRFTSFMRTSSCTGRTSRHSPRTQAAVRPAADRHRGARPHLLGRPGAAETVPWARSLRRSFDAARDCAWHGS
jgi:hypothetical protein